MSTNSTCPYCGTGCGVIVETAADDSITVRGDTLHPANYGRLCSKGSALAETLTDDNRLLYPEINGQQASWNQTIDHVARSLTDTIEKFGPESVAFYVSGQLLTEDYYVVNKLVKGWFGTANIDSNSRLCMASSVVGHKRAFGTDTVPGCYADLEAAELIVLVGSNLAWCHPVVYQRIMAEKLRRPELFLVVIDPRRTVTADQADLHLPIKPDADTRLFNSLLSYLAQHGAIDQRYIDQHVSGFDDALDAAGEVDVAGVAAEVGVDPQLLLEFFEKVCITGKTVTLYSQGVNQSRSGSDKVNAIINCHLATGRIGKPGMGPFSITGQPNAMGGREVGGLATMLAAHMELGNPEHRDIVQSFWDSPAIAAEPGLCAVDLFDAIGDGRIKAVWIMGTNPVDSLPEADRVKAALQACPLVIVSDVVSSTDTLDCAHVRLPAQAWGEKDGTVSNSERCISRQRQVRTPVGEARPDWWAVCQVACRMGFRSGFNYSHAADIFREHARLSAFANNGSRDFDIGACAHLSIDEYESLKPFYWPWIKGQTTAEPVRFFANGHFFTPDKKARMLPVQAALPGNADLSDHYPLILNTGRNRDQWHTMTRTGYSARLSAHLGEPYLEIHPHDALIHGIQDADIVRVRSPHSDVLLRALLSDRQVAGQLFAPMHWTDEFASRARVDSLIGSVTDPYSRQPASKSQAVSIQRFDAASYGYALLHSKPDKRLLDDIHYWAMAPVKGGWQIEVAGSLTPAKLDALMATRLTRALQPSGSEPLSYLDPASGLRKRAVFESSKLELLLFTGSKPVLISRSWAADQLATDWTAKATRWKLLAGRPSIDQPDKGAIVCSCFSVGVTQIETAITTKRCRDVKSVGNCLQAGTNCGSCRSEIQGILNRCDQTLKRKCTTSPSRMM